MGGRLYGFLESRTVFENKIGEWELVLKTEPITGSTGSFREVFYNNQYTNIFNDMPINKGFPDDISPETRAVMYSGIRLGHIDTEDIKFPVSESKTLESLPDESFNDYRWALDLDFYRNFEENAFWITGDQFREIDFKQTVSQKKIEEILSGLKEHGYGHDPAELQRLFKLTKNGQEHSRRWITHKDKTDLAKKEVRQLVKEGSIEKDEKKFKLEPKTMEEVLGNSWRKIWSILNGIRAKERKEVRLIFYWNH